MYQPYPSGAGQGPLPPQPVLTAIKFMYAGAGLSVVSLIVGLATIGSLKSAFRTADPSLTTHQINTAVGATLAFVIIFGLIGVGLWIWMAMANRAGKKWARIVASVLFGIDTLGLLSAMVRPHTLFSLLLSVLIWLAGLGAIIFLWHKESSAYYQAVSGPAGY